MPSQEYLEEIAETLNEREVGLDHTFKFKCHGCGKCCKNRDDILLTSRDLFNISRCLNMKPEEVIKKYCDHYVGRNSRIPIIRLQPVGPNMKCPLLQDKHCIVHSSKPGVCALYPLGRFIKFEKEDLDELNAEDLIVRYLINPVECGGHRNNTVKSWLESFGIDTDDKWYRMWTTTTMRLGTFIKKLEDNQFQIPDAGYEAIWNVAATQLYILYDIEKDYLPQFEANIAEMWRMLEKMDKELIQPFLRSKKVAEETA